MTTTPLPTHPSSNWEIAKILTDEYFSIGTTPVQAIATMWADFAEGRLADNLAEWGISEAELVAHFIAFAKTVTECGALHKLITPND